MNLKNTEVIDTIKENLTEILKLKNSLHKIQNTFEIFNNRLDQADKKISKLKDGPFEITQAKIF